MNPEKSQLVQEWLDRASPDQRALLGDHLRYDAIYARLVTQMRLLLRARGLTQRTLADRMQTSESAVSRMLNARTVRNIQLATLVRFARAVDVDLQTSLFDLTILGEADVGSDVGPSILADTRTVQQRPHGLGVFAQGDEAASSWRPSKYTLDDSGDQARVRLGRGDD